jgi:uncharacterized protein (DUF305 family)
VSDAPTGEEPADQRWASVGAPLLAGTAVLALVLGTLVGWLVFAPHHPGDDGVEAGFARDMYEHHAQAVEMSLLALDQTEDDAVYDLAWDIATSQSNQMGQMEGWIKLWDLSMARTDPRMAWMGHDPSDLPEDVPMPGMATAAEMDQLRQAGGEESDVLFLQLMITHHLSGVEMAEAAVDLAAEAEVLRLARAMANAQESEIGLMADMLAERGAAPREDLAALPAEDAEESTHGH